MGGLNRYDACRKRGDERDLPAAKRVAETKRVERPKPKPLTKG
jgi:hypothetical protein